MRLFLLALFAATSSVHAQTNYNLRFAGTNQTVSIGSPIPANSSYTKMAWIYTTNTSGNQNIISSNANPFWISNGRMYAGNAGNYQLVTDPAVMVTGRWVHVAVTYDQPSQTMRLYRDGVQIATRTSAPAPDGGAEFIGSHAGGASYFNGSIDEVKVWTRALPLAEIKANLYKDAALTSPGLVRYYKFDQGSGTTLTNELGSNHGSLINLPTWELSAVQYASNAVQLDGGNDYISLPHFLSGSFTLEYWIRTTAAGSAGSHWFNGNGIVDADVSGSTNDWGTSVVGSKLAFGIGQSGNDQTIFSTSNINTGNWTHVAVSWNQSTGAQRLYINGTLEATGTASTNLRSAPTGIAIGRLLTGSAYFTGAVDDIRFWNTVRSDAEIQNNRFSQLVPENEPALVSYYSFNFGIANGSNSGVGMVHDEKGNNNGTLNNFTMSGIGSNFVAQNIALVTLPVQWKTFTAVASNGAVQLNWTTSVEENNQRFDIEHSSDNRIWTRIGTVAAAGSSAGDQQYAFTHGSPTKGSNFYRIVQYDFDGRHSSSAIRRVEWVLSNNWTLLEQPVRNQTLRIRATESGPLNLYSGNGALLLQTRVQAGINQIPLPSLTAGIYYLEGNGLREKILVR